MAFTPFSDKLSCDNGKSEMIVSISKWFRLRAASKLVFRGMSSTRVKVNQGVVKGCEENLPNGQKFLRFSGIPYAKPPINELRYKSPQKLVTFDQDELDCTRERDPCFHKSTLTRQYVGSEDCLNLNVYVPPQSSSGEKLTVMVYIHGGGFKYDSNTRQL